MRRATGLSGTLPLLRYALATTYADPSVLLVGGLMTGGPLFWLDVAGQRRGSLEELLGMQLTVGIVFSHIALLLWVLRRLRRGAGRLALGGVCGARGGLLLAAYGTAVTALSPAGLLVAGISARRHGAPGLAAAILAIPVVCGVVLAVDGLALMATSQRAWPEGPLGQLRDSWRLAGMAVAIAFAIVPWRVAAPWLGDAGGAALAAACCVPLLAILAGPIERLARRE